MEFRPLLHQPERALRQAAFQHLSGEDVDLGHLPAVAVMRLMSLRTRIGVQLRVTVQRLRHALIVIPSTRRQGTEETRGEAGALFFWQAQWLDGDLINAHTNRG